jgi:hypothetical protein
MIASATSRLIDAAGRVVQPRLIGVERVPTSGGFLLVGNHTLLDTDGRIGAPVRALATRLTGRSDLGTMALRGFGPTLLPRPERFYFSFGSPIDTRCWSGFHESEEAQEALRDPHRGAVSRLRRGVTNSPTRQEVVHG